jgi:hypothetical protein
LNWYPKTHWKIFGDEWLFEVEFRGTGVMEKNEKYPRIIQVKGESPKQYERLKLKGQTRSEIDFKPNFIAF